MQAAPSQEECIDDLFRPGTCETLQGRWQHEWEVHHRRRNKLRLQRRAILALSLLAEPAQLHWSEVLLDTMFLAWKDAIDEWKRSREQSAERQRFEETLESAFAKQNDLIASPRWPLDSLLALRSMKADILMVDHDILMSSDGIISRETVKTFLRDLDDTLTIEAAHWLAGLIPCSQNGTIAIDDIMSWLLEVSFEQLASVTESWDEQCASWQDDWETHQREQRKRLLRRRAIIALGLIAEPLQMQWSEAYLDVVFSAWSDYVSDDHRTWALSAPRRLFERAAKAQACGSLQATSRSSEDLVLAARLEAQQTLSRHGAQSLSDEECEAVVRQVAPGMEPDQMQLLLHAVPRSSGGGIPVDGLMAWIFGSAAH